MQDWLQELWRDLTERTILYPLEFVLVVLCWLTLQIPQLRALRGTILTQWFGSVARRSLVATILVFLLALLGAILVDGGAFPPPGVHDEFSYLLAAQTFAAGRMTNPPHPMRSYFESFHVLHEPSYMSMYPPAQGLALASGIVIAGDPAWGVRFSVAALAAAICWMLRGWMPPKWALLGGLICTVRICWFSYWSHSYWGGAMPAIGGALLMGAAGRIVNRGECTRNGALLALGTLILANSRPWEGGLCTACVLAWLAFSRNRTQLLRRVIPGFAAVLLPGVATMTYYNYRVTGDPLHLPYLANRARYQTHGSFVWENPSFEKTYSYSELRRFYVESEGYPEKLGYARVQADKPKRVWFFFLGPALSLALLGVAGAWRANALRLPLLVLTIGFFASHLLVRWDIQPHYFGPPLGAAYIAVCYGLRVLCAWRRHRWLSGRALVSACVAGCLLMALVRIAAPALGVKVFQEITYPWYSYGPLANFHRQRVEAALKSRAGKHLVLVEYSADHRPEIEWVYNDADIDNSSLVWARYAGSPERIQPLLDYYKNRKIWWINPDRDPTRIVDYRDILQQGTTQ